MCGEPIVFHQRRFVLLQRAVALSAPTVELRISRVAGNRVVEVGQGALRIPVELLFPARGRLPPRQLW